MTVTYRGGPLDGRVARIGDKVTRVEIPLYGRGYACRPTGWAVYVRAGRFLVARRTR